MRAAALASLELLHAAPVQSCPMPRDPFSYYASYIHPDSLGLEALVVGRFRPHRATRVLSCFGDYPLRGRLAGKALGPEGFVAHDDETVLWLSSPDDMVGAPYPLG